MKALTLHQPWASLVALGVKSIETRSWSTKYRGPMAIHASAKRGRTLTTRPGSWNYGGLSRCLWRKTEDHHVADYQHVPVGAVVATCTLVDVVPTQDIEWGQRYEGTPAWWWDDGIEQVDEGRDGEPIVDLVRRPGYLVDESQRPYGDFTPGRFAWLLADIEPLDPPAVSPPGEWHRGLWEWTP